MPTKRSRKTSKRTVIQPRKSDRRYVRRNKAGQFKKEVNVGRSLAADRRRKAKTKVAAGLDLGSSALRRSPLAWQFRARARGGGKTTLQRGIQGPGRSWRR